MRLRSGTSRRPLRRARLDAGATLREAPTPEAPVVTMLESAMQVEVVGAFAGPPGRWCWAGIG